jgi:four helix bundle protein
MSTFVALDLSLELVTAIARPLARVRTRDASLARQLRRAVQSVALNLGEGSGRHGEDRRNHFRTAHGSLIEVRTALAVAARWSYLAAADYEAAEQIADRLARLLWRLTR